MTAPRRILVVDNDPFERISCRAMLRGPEYIVLFCEDRGSAIEKVMKEDFELIVTNIRLPNKYTGLTLVQELRFLKPKADIVVTADDPSIWDAREAIRLGASGYMERPFSPECLMHVALKTFDTKGWIVSKTCIDRFRDYFVPAPGTSNPTLFYKNGSWARHIEGDVWEVGYDTRYWLPIGRHKNEAWEAQLDGSLRPSERDMKSTKFCDHILSLQMAGGLRAISAGEPYAKVVCSTGKTYALPAPMTGTVEDINGRADEIMTSLDEDNPGPDWPLWLARVRAKAWDYGTERDIEEGRLVGNYCTVP